VIVGVTGLPGAEGEEGKNQDGKTHGVRRGGS